MVPLSPDDGAHLRGLSEAIAAIWRLLRPNHTERDPGGRVSPHTGSRSAIEWIIGRYQVKTEKLSGIVNDPNDWSREVEDPRYIGLLARIVTVRFETMQIVDSLPAPAIRA